MKHDLIIARYNEDISWLKELDENKYNIIIYNKGDENIDFPHIRLDNYGRESQTYLYHIVNNYNTLSDVIIFLQGFPFDHTGGIGNLDNTTLCPVLNNLSFDKNFFEIGHTHRDGSFYGERQTIIEKLKLNGEIDYFTVGAQFAVNKEYIVDKPLSFWQTLLDWSEPNNGEFCHFSMPYILERLWVNIFNTNLTK